MFLAQALKPDRSCQNIVNDAAVKRLTPNTAQKQADTVAPAPRGGRGLKLLLANPECYYACIQIEFRGEIMASMSIRGLDDQALIRLKNQAEQEGSSLNGLVLRLLQGTGMATQPGALKKFDDLDALAGTWSDEEAQAFERNTAAFAEVDAMLWN